MKAKRLCSWFLVAGALTCGAGTASAQDGWMRPGVRVWYLGAVDGGGVTSSNAEEAFLFDAIEGANAQIVHHSAQTHWTAPLPVQNGSYPLLDMGPCWIHPLRLQTLQMGEHWMGQEITLIERPTYTYETFPYRLLPIGALFALSPQREIVKLTYMMPGFSVGNAYFDADTGILLYRHALWGTTKMFFILAEINYDFAGQAAYPEDDGPHAGFRSFISEQSLGSTWGVGGGSVAIHALVEARYGKTVEMRVMSAISAAYGSKQADENFCFFGDVPVVKAITATQAPDYPPEQWTPFGEYLWWWLPRTARQNQTINVIGVPLARTADDPLAFTATTVPTGFHFNALWFDARGYVTAFGAKDPTIGLDVQPGDMFFQNGTMVDGLSYYLSTMAKPFPVNPRGDFTGDLKSDILWRHATGGDLWLWPMDGAAKVSETYVRTVADTNWEIRGQGDMNGDGKADLLWRHRVSGMLYYWPMDGTTPLAETYVGTVDPAYDIVGTGDFNGDGKSDILWRHTAQGDVWVWLMDGATPLSRGVRRYGGPRLRRERRGRRGRRYEGGPGVARGGGGRVGVADERADAPVPDVRGDGGGHALPDPAGGGLRREREVGPAVVERGAGRRVDLADGRRHRAVGNLRGRGPRHAVPHPGGGGLQRRREGRHPVAACGSGRRVGVADERRGETVADVRGNRAGGRIRDREDKVGW